MLALAHRQAVALRHKANAPPPSSAYMSRALTSVCGGVTQNVVRLHASRQHRQRRLVTGSPVGLRAASRAREPPVGTVQRPGDLPRPGRAGRAGRAGSIHFALGGSAVASHRAPVGWRLARRPRQTVVGPRLPLTSGHFGRGWAGASAWKMSAPKVSAGALRGDGTTEPAFRFGLLADIQYTDTDDKCNVTGTQWRRYRNSLNVASGAVKYFNAHELDFVLHNGDIIDHQCAFDFAADEFKPKSEALDQLGEVMRILSDAKCGEWIFTIGNHELYNFTRDELRDGVVAPGASLPFKCANQAGEFYYSFSPAPGWRVMVLNAYDVSIYAKGREQGLDVEALNLLCQHNENCAKWVADNPQVIQTERMSGTFPYFKDLEGLNNRWVPFNGGIGAAQLAWMKDELARAAENGERVMMFSHLLVHPETTSNGSGRTLLWNYDEVLETLEDPAWAHCISAVISGHQHEGGLHTTEAGTHFVVMESPMLAEPGQPGPYAVVEVRGDVLSFVGHGRGAGSHIFPPSLNEEDAVPRAGGDAAADAVPLIRHLPLRPLVARASGAGDETSHMKASL